MNILTLTSLYPNPVQIRHGIFVRERLKHVLAQSAASARIVAPVPWFPLAHRAFGRFADFARVPAEETDLGSAVFHPRYVVIPKVGDAVTPLTYRRSVERLIRADRIGPIDLIDAHFLFPDGAAAVMLGRRLGCPVVVTARGSDANTMPAEFAAGRWIRWTLANCDAAVAVSRGLGRKLRALGAPAERVHVFPNGVDSRRFRIVDRPGARERLGLAGPTVLSVGNLRELKGHHLIIDAVREIDDVRLVIVGRGRRKAELFDQIHRLGLGDRVTIRDEVDQETLVDYYNAADCLVLASSSEGMPNVVLESMACGTPVIATDIEGCREVLDGARTAMLLAARTASDIRDAIREMLRRNVDRAQVRSDVARFTWDSTASGVTALFRSLTDRSAGAGVAGGSPTADGGSVSDAHSNWKRMEHTGEG